MSPRTHGNTWQKQKLEVNHQHSVPNYCWEVSFPFLSFLLVAEVYLSVQSTLTVGRS